MPHAGHILTGLAIGAATRGDAHQPLLRDAWLGACVLLATLPDVLGWGLSFCGARLPHNALASLPVATVGCLTLLAVTARWREPWMVGAAAGLALVSHTVLDMLDGEIPLWWPISELSWGISLLGIEYAGTAALTREFLLFGPLVAVAIGVGLLRSGGSSKRSSSFSAWMLRALLLNTLAGLPVAALAGATLYGRAHLESGHKALAAGDFEAARRHFVLAQRFASPGSAEDARYWYAESLKGLGQERAALGFYLAEIRTDPNDLPMRYGLAHLYLHARDSQLRDPDYGLRLLEQVVADAPPGPYRRMAEGALGVARTYVRSLERP